MLPSAVMIEEYLDEAGQSPFARWFEALGPVAAAKVAVAVTRISVGAVSNVKGVGGGVLEYRMNSGPGYWIYFGRDGERLVILLGGGSKHRQQTDIQTAKARWGNYKVRKAMQMKGDA